MENGKDAHGRRVNGDVTSSEAVRPRSAGRRGEPARLFLAGFGAAILAVLSLAGCQPTAEGTVVHVAQADSQPAKSELPGPPEPDIKGIKLGDSVESFQKKFSFAACLPDKNTGETAGCIANGVSYATVTGMLTVTFENRKVVTVSIRNLDRNNFPVVTRALAQRMGPPSDEVAKLLFESPGSLAWGGPKWVFTASPTAFEGKPGVLLMDRTYLKNQLDRQAKDAAADL